MRQFGRSMRHIVVLRPVSSGAALAVHTRAASSRPSLASAEKAAPSQRGAAPVDLELHKALRGLLVERLCSPSQPLPAKGVYDELAKRSRLVEEFHFTKTSRRLTRQRLALQFLRRYNVLLHGLLFYSPTSRTWNTTAEFPRLAMLGKSVLVAEVRTRLLKLFPDMPYSTYVKALPHMVGEEALAAAFHRYEMQRIVGARPLDRRSGTALTRVQQSSMLCAIVGEMYWFVSRTKPTDLTHNNALFPPSDVLILHVLCTHLLESVPAELIYNVLEPIVVDVKRAWVNEPMSLPSQLRLTPRTVGALSLNTVPVAPPATSDDADAASAVRRRHMDARARQHAPTETADDTWVKSFMRPSCDFRLFDGPRYRRAGADEPGARMTLASERSPPPRGDAPAAENDAARIARTMELAKLAVRR